MQEQKQGVISKVSGPVVVAKGLTGAKMFEVVKVSNKKLTGEIIELKGDTASIQVYEETSGIGPGEPVYLTGQPLAVELGPGMLTSIYDGVQRPLNVLNKKAGAFITRGIDAPGLSREKKWKFEAVVEQGTKVKPGDIIGEVQETTLIKHKIMIPSKVSGTVEEIKNGEFTVKDSIARVNGKEIKMLQTWPIRQSRPVKEKVQPKETLITGQRVIDTFFPITKGGTACVPGPFGSGKCVHGSTPVLLGDGTIKEIKQIFKENKNNGKKVKNKYEEYTILNKPLEIFTYQNGKIIKNKIKAVYKGKTQKLIKIKTRTGREAIITPIHKLFTINKNLKIQEKQARFLKKGNYLITPRRIKFRGSLQKINLFNIFNKERVGEQKILSKIPKLIDRLVKEHNTRKKIAKLLETNYSVLQEYYKGRNKPTIDFTKKLYHLADQKLEISKIKEQRQSHIVNIPNKIDEKMAEFLGFMYGDGMIKGSSIRFYNNDEKIQKRFAKLTKELFKLTPKRTIVNTVKTSLVSSSILAKLIKYFDYPEYKKSKTCFVPDIILKSSNKIVAKFLGAYFLSDGYMGNYDIEIATSSSKMSSHLSYLLMRLGIIHKRISGKIRNFSRYRIIISGKDEIKRFYQQCDLGSFTKFVKMKKYISSSKRIYNSLDIAPSGKVLFKKYYEKHDKPYTKLLRQGIEISNYIRNQELMSKTTFQKFARTLNEPILSKFAFNELEHIYCDKIIEIKEINKEKKVYDLEVPKGHNFVGGICPMIYHNTVVQHQLAKWSDADIIIYAACGERGNEVCDVLTDFPELIDPKSGKPLMERTIIVANTSNMPVAAREASVYTAVTMAEYYRDMGYKVALMADSTSRWAEALREISGRLGEMPGEEGYPAYLGSRTAAFYERAGKASCLCSDERDGSVSVIGAVSPPGGDLSEPVTQNTLRVVKVFWGLDSALAYRRHYPAINWLTSYSLYLEDTQNFMIKQTSEDWPKLREESMKILQEEAALQEIVRLVGLDALSPREQWLLESAKSIREDFLQQNAFDDVDAYTSIKHQYLMLKTILTMYHEGLAAVKRGVKIDQLNALEDLKTKISRTKLLSDKELNKIEDLINKITKTVQNLKTEE